MEQTKQDLENIKTKLLEQIKTQYPEDKSNEYIEKIKAMQDDEFIEFLKTQGMLESEKTSQCIFCALASGRMPRTEIGENQKAIAILELNPVSKGHSLILPKEHLESESQFTQEIYNLAEKIKADLQRAFRPKRIDFVSGNIMGHQIINIIPVYNSESIESERTEQTPESLASIKKEIENSEIKTIEEVKPTIIEEPTKEKETIEKQLWLRPRIP